MEALLHHALTPREVNAVSALGLAHMGDAVSEILVRSMLVLVGRTTSGQLHRETTAYVCAPAQAEAVDRLLPHLTEEETGYYRRGRNAAVHNIPKNATHAQYSKATGLEALFGALYLLGQTERIRALFTIIMEDRHAT